MRIMDWTRFRQRRCHAWAASPKPVLTRQIRRNKARRALAVRGMMEAVTWSFIPKSMPKLFGGGNATLALANPISGHVGHASEPAAWAFRRRAAQCRPRLW
jgi:phenylalanyl-tRNA synthetase beta subunit